MKQLFNFYLDTDVKERVNDKLTRLNGEYSKGQVAALIRVLLSNFVNTPDEQIDKKLLLQIEEEYVLSQLKNKRSKL